MRRDVFQAIADPTRREIINLIAHRPLNLNSIAENFSVSRPAISKHIKILIECGLVTIQQEGREHYCSMNFRQFKEVSDWIDQYRVFWTKKLDALGQFLEKEAAQRDKGTGQREKEAVQKEKGTVRKENEVKHKNSSKSK